MNRLAVQFLDEGLHRVLFDAMPMPVFVVDKDVNILECNRAAASLLGQIRPDSKHRRGGDVLHCLHAAKAPEGCGRTPVCGNCQLQESVRAAFRGETVIRRWAEMELVHGGVPTKVNLRVSCQPFTYKKNPLILLVLEGLN